jgi:hypothetical protein
LGGGGGGEDPDGSGVRGGGRHPDAATLQEDPSGGVAGGGGGGARSGGCNKQARRLKDLALGISEEGRTYHAVSQGLAASGGDRPLPLLWRLGVTSVVTNDADLLASLLLPSVWVFISTLHSHDRSALLTACALRQAGYKHTWAPLNISRRVLNAAQETAQCEIVADSRLIRHWGSQNDP